MEGRQHDVLRCACATLYRIEEHRKIGHWCERFGSIAVIGRLDLRQVAGLTAGQTVGGVLSNRKERHRPRSLTSESLGNLSCGPVGGRRGPTAKPPPPVQIRAAPPTFPEQIWQFCG